MTVSVLASAVVHPLGCEDTLERECRAGAPSSFVASSRVSTDVLRRISRLNVWDENRMDRFSQLAIAAARLTLERSRLSQERVSECGIVAGNMLAGWTFTEPQLRNLHINGLSSVSPYVAVAWFPAAPQGEASIRLGLRGYSKTITTDRCAGSQAIGLAYRRILSGRSDILLAGGVEAPIVPIVMDAFKGSGGTGWVSEGAAFLLMSAGAESHIRIGGYESASLDRQSNPNMSQTTPHLLKALKAVSTNYQIRLVVFNVPYESKEELICNEIIESLGANEPPAPLFTTRAVGECFAASGAIGTAIAVSVLRRQAGRCSAVVVTMGSDNMDMIWFYRTA